MEKSRIIIVEDNLPYAVEMEMNLVKWGYEVLGIYDNGEEALKYIKLYRPDVILMDVRIKGKIDGVDIGKKIKHLNIPIIYMTGLKEEFVLDEAKNTIAISYLIKPFDLLSLKGALSFAFTASSEITTSSCNTAIEEESIFVKRGTEYTKILLNTIFWIQADKNYCYIFCEQGKFIQRMSLASLLKQLSSTAFIQIHKSYGVQLKYIEKISLSKNEVSIKGTVLPIGRAYKEGLVKRIKMIQ